MLRRSRSSAASADAEKALLDAAVAVLSVQPDAPLERIAARAGIEPRAVRDRFPTREALMTAVVMRGAHRLAAAAVREDGSPAEQLALLVARLWDDQAPVASFTAWWMRAQVRSDVERALEPVRALLADAIGAGAERGSLRADLAPSTVAWLVEHAVLTCLVGVAEGALSAKDGRRLAITHALGAAGLAWDHAHTVADAAEQRLGHR